MLKSKPLNIHRYLEISGDNMMKQINLKIPDTLFSKAKKHVDKYGYKNIQELALESMREKIFNSKEEYDETFTKRELELIEKFVEKVHEEGDFIDADELFRILDEK